MCGISGIIDKNQTDLSTVEALVAKMNNCIVHRGPDSNGIHSQNLPVGGFAMGMQRLSIIDLHQGDQPIYNENKTISIVFNGEIYNYPSLKKILQDQGINFTTKSDTEVILKIYELEGVQGLKRLDGMYAFSILDNNKNKLFIARDYFGEKPLYYYNTSSRFLYASELKSIISVLEVKPKICKKGFNLYMRLTYIPSPFTIYQGVKKLEPNSLLTLDLNTLDFTLENIHKKNLTEIEEISFNDAKEQTKQLVYNSVKSRSISDVPLGTFLSGGVDSSIVSWCLADLSEQKINTFSIGFRNKNFNETDKSQSVAKIINSNHHEFILDDGDLKNNLDAILLNFDEPFADSSALPTYLVSKKTREHVKVALTGDGGDEVFGGYNKYYAGKINEKYTSVVPKFLHNFLDNISTTFLNDKTDKRGLKYRINRMVSSIDYDDHYYWNIISLGYSNSELQQYIQHDYINNNEFKYYKENINISRPKSLNEFRKIDQRLSLEGDMLVKVDRTSMLNSLECRAPFLNKALFDFTLGLPDNFLMKGWNKKYLLKEAFKTEFPKGFLDKPKQGFGVPVGNWLRNSLKAELTDYIDCKFLEEQGIFNKNQIINLVQNHLNSKKDNSFKVWTFYCFQKWYKQIYLG